MKKQKQRDLEIMEEQAQELKLLKDREEIKWGEEHEKLKKEEKEQRAAMV